MIHRISESITDFLISKEVIEREEADIYVYGYETLLSGVIDFAIVTAIGCLTGHLLNALVFFIMFVSVRMYSGGYHAQTYGKCKLTMVLLLLAVLGISMVKLPLSAVCLLLILLLITVWFRAPVENTNKPLDALEKKKYRRISVILSAFWGIAALIAYFFSNTISATIAGTGFFIALLMVAAIYWKEEHADEKE